MTDGLGPYPRAHHHLETAAGMADVAEEVVVWEKLRALREGANLATRRLL